MLNRYGFTCVAEGYISSDTVTHGFGIPSEKYPQYQMKTEMGISLKNPENI